VGARRRGVSLNTAFWAVDIKRMAQKRHSDIQRLTSSAMGIAVRNDRPQRWYSGLLASLRSGSVAAP
jgi:predicted DNA-binding ribbon-helix-helix protein